MIAEIYNKISSSGSNLSDRLEDKLTGDFFGTLRYLPFEIALKPILRAVRFHEESHAIVWYAALDAIEGYAVEYIFWPHHAEGEIDLLLKHTDSYIGIEVKYHSSLSSVDEDTTDEPITPDNSNHQLARYARMLHEVGKGRSRFLIFLAPYDILFPVESGLQRNPVIVSEVKVGFLGWQDVLAAVQQTDLQSLEQWQRLILTDLQALLMKKKLTRYSGLPTELTETVITGEAYRYNKSNHTGQFIRWLTEATIEGSAYRYGNQ